MLVSNAETPAEVLLKLRKKKKLTHIVTQEGGGKGRVRVIVSNIHTEIQC